MAGLIIFDWDDVITLGSKEGYYACYRETLGEVGVRMPEDEMHRRIQKRWGQPFPLELEELLAEKPGLLQCACDIFARKFWGDTFTGSLREVNGANGFLSDLSKSYTLAVASGNHPDMLRKIMSAFGIPQVFKRIITSFDVPAGKVKPDPHMLVTVMEELGFGPQETVYVGDAETDVRMAQAAGVEPIVVLTGHLRKDQAQALGVKRIFGDVTGLPRDL